MEDGTVITEPEDLEITEEQRLSITKTDEPNIKMVCEGCRYRYDEHSVFIRRNETIEKNSYDFDCNICLNSVELPVVTQCGHLFCWVCLYQWAHKANICAICPICKCDLDITTVVTIFSKGANKILTDSGVPNPPPVKRKYTKKTMDIFTGGVFSLPDGSIVRGTNMFHITHRPRSTLLKNFLVSRVLCIVIAVGLIIFFIVE